MLYLNPYTLFLTFLPAFCICLYTTTPVWVTSPYIKAGSNNVIATLTGNTSTPTATIPYPGLPFTMVPNIGYGSTSYIGKPKYNSGNDALGS